MGRQEFVTPHEQTETETRQKARRWVLLVCLPIIFISSVVIAVTIGVLDRTLSAPDWLRSRIEARLAVMMPQTQVRFGDLSLQVQRNGLAQLALRDVDFETRDGAPIAGFSDVLVNVQPWSILKGTPKLQGVTLSGAFVTVRRDKSGRIALSLGAAPAPEGAFPDLPTLVRRFDAALQSPYLAQLTTVSADGLTLRYEDARARRAWTVDGGRADLVRDFGTVTIRGDFAVLGGRDTAASVSVSVESDEGESSLKLGVSMADVASEDISSQGPALAWLRALRAPISGALRAEMFEDGSLGPLDATLEIGQGVLQPNDETSPVPFSHARTEFTFEPDTGALTFDDISVASGWGDVQAEGRATLQDMTNGWPARMLGQFTLRDINTNPDGFFDQALTLARVDADFMLDLNPFRVRLGQLYFDDPDLPLRAKGELVADPKGWRSRAELSLEGMTDATLERLWPSHLKPVTRRWIVTNILEGVMTQGRLVLRKVPDQPATVEVDADFSQATVRFLKQMPPLEKARGKLTLQDNRMVVWLASGQIQAPQGGPVDVSGSVFAVPDVRVPNAPVTVDLELQGAITSGLSVLDLPPLRIMQRAGQPVDLAQGEVSAQARLGFDLAKNLKPDDIRFTTTAKMRDVQTDKLIRGRQLSAKVLALNADNDMLSIEGAATLDGVPARGVWRQPLGPAGQEGSVFSGHLQVSQSAADAFGIALPENSLSGRAESDLEVLIKRGTPPAFRLTSDLAGLGARLAPLGWQISKDRTGELEISGTLGEPAVIDRIAINAGKLSAVGALRLTEDGGLDRLTFSSVRMADWLRAPITLVGRGAGRAPAIEINGGSLDMRKIPAGGSTSSLGTVTPVSLALETLQISEGMRLSDFRGAFDTGAGFSGEFTARVNGDAPIRGAAVAQDGRTSFRIQSDDAGRVMKAAGLIKSAKSGQMDLTLVPTADEGVYDGTLKIQNISLQDAPAIAGLLDAISIVGLIDQLQTGGIFFANVEAKFRLTPDRVILTRSSATGPSMGLALDGYYDLSSGQMDMQGTLSPLFLLNGIGSILTRKGEGLFAFGFTLGGTADAPKVSVNPLSVLTPGMFREIFRRPAPKLSQ
ncbi:MAG: DUF3971 domain-containing protein [Rhodobacteraceae bacterium]|nr:DUF3971 domain-containing protein [Paracoccaceae bacterium]